MGGLISLLGEPWTQGALTAALSVITAIYACLTWSIAKSNKIMTDQVAKQTEALVRPIVGFRITTRYGTILSLILENSGKSIATDIEIEIDRDFFQFSEHRNEKNLRNFSAFKNPIASMAAGEKMTFDLSQGFNLNKSEDGVLLTPMEFEISTRYKFGEVIYCEKQIIDLNPYMSSLAVKTPLEHLEQIEKHLKKIAEK
ncbi:MAG: hypothetical protein M9908_00215 [Phyllobacteriaceae bacterium]|nr:hypothetical protein [Phyllobacteriaceae bacterium]